MNCNTILRQSIRWCEKKKKVKLDILRFISSKITNTYTSRISNQSTKYTVSTLKSVFFRSFTTLNNDQTMDKLKTSFDTDNKKTKRKKYSIPPTPLNIVIFLLSLGISSTLLYDFLDEMNRELDTIQEWAPDNNQDFDSVTVGVDDLTSPLRSVFLSTNPQSLSDWIYLIITIPFRAFKSTLRTTAYTLRASFIMIRFVPLLFFLGLLIFVDYSLSLVTHHVIVSPLDTVSPSPSLSSHSSPLLPLFNIWWSTLAIMLEHSGPTFIKLGQYLSSRPDLLSTDVCRLLSDLRDKTEPHSWEWTEFMLQTHLGEDWENYIFVSPQDRLAPIGSGCIAQVYRAYVKLSGESDLVLPEASQIDPRHIVVKPHHSEQLDQSITSQSEVGWAGVDWESTGNNYYFEKNVLANSGNSPNAIYTSYSHPPDSDPSSDPSSHSPYLEVAVKVLHPSSMWTIHRDLRLLYVLASLLDYLPLSPLSAVSTRSLAIEFSRLMYSQLDLSQEARNLQRFHSNFPRPKDSMVVQPLFPMVLCGRSGVLIETFHAGVPVDVLMQSSVDSSSSSPSPSISLADVPTHSNSSSLFQTDLYNALPLNAQLWLREECAKTALDTFLHMLFAHGFFHADLHPGNIMLDLGYSSKPEHRHLLERLETTDATLAVPSEVFCLIHADDMRLHATAAPAIDQLPLHDIPLPFSTPRLVILDAGMATALFQRDKENFNDLFYSIATGHGEEGAALVIERAKPQHKRSLFGTSSLNDDYGPPEIITLSNGKQVRLSQVPHHPVQTQEDRRLFIERVGSLISDAYRHGFNLNGMGVVSTLQALAVTARECNVTLDPSFVTVVIAVTVMEGVGRALSADCDILTPSVSIVAKCKMQEAKEGVAKMISKKNSP